MGKNYKIFISHTNECSDDMKSLKKILDQKGFPNVDFEEASKELSVDCENSEYTKQVLKRKIANADLFIAISSNESPPSDWLQWEMQTSYENQVPIIGVVPWGKQTTSSAIKEYSAVSVKWNTESIINAIITFAK